GRSPVTTLAHRPVPVPAAADRRCAGATTGGAAGVRSVRLCVHPPAVVHRRAAGLPDPPSASAAREMAGALGACLPADRGLRPGPVLGDRGEGLPGCLGTNNGEASTVREECGVRCPERP